jgi:ABC-type uncharacterized transport system YnjBCD substrate-binding protein
MGLVVLHEAAAVRDPAADVALIARKGPELPALMDDQGLSHEHAAEVLEAMTSADAQAIKNSPLAHTFQTGEVPQPNVEREVPGDAPWKDR